MDKGGLTPDGRNAGAALAAFAVMQQCLTFAPLEPGGQCMWRTGRILGPPQPVVLGVVKPMPFLDSPVSSAITMDVIITQYRTTWAKIIEWRLNMGWTMAVQ